MSVRFASSKNAIAECDICGFRYKLTELRELIKNGVTTNIKACPTCWGPDHPQNEQGKYPVDDPQAIRDPRPDFAGYAQSRAQIIAANSSGGPNPIGLQAITPIIGSGFVGQVVVTTS
tara:strand:+ start:204 stop:557 length:354 start_codon:yes stop_codon:yes gene_type:complete